MIYLRFSETRLPLTQPYYTEMNIFTEKTISYEAAWRSSNCT